MTHKIAPAQYVEVADAYSTGTTAGELAGKYGCSLTVVYRVLKRQGVARRPGNPPRLTEAQELAMLGEYGAGAGKKALLAKYGIGEGAFLGARRRHGVGARDRVPTSSLFTPSQERDIVTAYQAGAGLAALGEQYGCCLETIRKVLQRQGVARRRRGNCWTDLSQAQMDEIGRRWQEGESQKRIGQSLGISQPVIARILSKNGVGEDQRRQQRERHGMWKGGRIRWGPGYIAVLMDGLDSLSSMRNASGYVLEHRLVMGRALGRPLARTETVHHINGDRQDNRLVNLQLRQGNHGNGVVMTCSDCGSHDVVAAPIAEAGG